MASSTETQPNGRIAAAISNAVVGLFHDYTGRGPTKARTDSGPSAITVLMADTLTKAERRLVDHGQDKLVLQTRSEFQRLMRDDLIATVEQLSGRKVLAFMSQNHIDPDIAAEVFVLDPFPDPTRGRIQTASASRRGAEGSNSSGIPEGNGRHEY